MIDPEKLAQITTLDAGTHDPTSGAMCAMEAAAWIAGEPWSDHPQCVSPVIAAFLRTWNDALPDADRTRLLLPLIPDTIGTRTTDADDETRAWMATDWIVRVFAPAWLQCARLTDHAQRLASGVPIADPTTADTAIPLLLAARDAARDAAGDAAWAAARDDAGYAAGYAAGDAAWAAARDDAGYAAGYAARAAAGDAAGDAAWAAAQHAARDAAWAAAWAAAGDAAWAAAWDDEREAARQALVSTVHTLQASAQELVRAMCAVGRVAAAEQEATS